MRQKGFTLIELMVVVAILGVLVSIAIPAYFDYLVRTRVVEGLHLATTAKLAVAETTLAKHALPASQEETGYNSPAATANVKSITINQKGSIVIRYTARAGDGTIILVPTLQTQGELTWTCNEGTLASKYRPANCRM